LEGAPHSGGNGKRVEEFVDELHFGKKGGKKPLKKSAGGGKKRSMPPALQNWEGGGGDRRLKEGNTSGGKSNVEVVDQFPLLERKRPPSPGKSRPRGD